MLVALGIVSFGFSTAMLLVWRFLLAQSPLLLWSIALGCNGAGICLVALRGQLPDLLSILAANLLIIGGCGLIWVGTCHYRGIKPYYRTVLVTLLLSLPFYVRFTWIEPSIAYRVIICRTYIILYMVAATATLLHASGKPLTRMEKATAGALLTNAVLPLLGIMTQLADLSYLAPMFRNAIIRFSATTGLISVTVWSLAAILLILEKVVAEKEKTEEIFNQFMRFTPVYTFIKKICDDDSISLHVSANYEQMLGIKPEAMIGKPMRELFPAALAEQIIADDKQVAQSGSWMEREEELNGRHYSTIKFPINYSGAHSVIAGFTIDITERKRAEAEKVRLESQYRQLQKVESLGRMAGAIAHKFNNLLGAVMGNLELAMTRLPPGGQPLTNLEEAMKAAGRAAEVSSLMLTYLGQTSGRAEPLDLATTCRQSLGALRAAMPQEVELTSELPPVGPVIKVNEHQLQQLLTNLMTNAWEALDGNRGVVHLTVKTVSPPEITETHRFPLGWQPEDNLYACLEVTDSGCGIADKDIDELFDPFFTTKFTGRGLGLAVVLGIAKAHRGAVAVESRAGHGSVLQVFFPLSAETIPAQPEHPLPTAAVAWAGTILLVEDDQLVRKTTAIMLSHLGFSVLEAKDGIEAVEVFRLHKDTICCVLSDLTMPRMDGWETLAALRRLAPGIPVILASGYDQAQVMAGDHPEWPQAFLGKPYRLTELSAAFRQALECPAAAGVTPREGAS
jgi:PAS domain S-box-containing protein